MGPGEWGKGKGGGKGAGRKGRTPPRHWRLCRNNTGWPPDLFWLQSFRGLPPGEAGGRVLPGPACVRTMQRHPRGPSPVHRLKVRQGDLRGTEVA